MKHHSVTKRQLECLDFIIKFQEEFGYSPTYQQIADGLKCSSPNICKLIILLEAHGLIKKPTFSPRSIEVIQLPIPEVAHA